MTFEDFLKKCDSVIWDGETHHDEHTISDGFLKIEWCTGGMHGASCWDEGEPSMYSTDGRETPMLTGLPAIITSVAPEYPLLDYTELLMADGFQTTDTRSDADYYGNTDHYSSISFNLRLLYDKLIEGGWIDAP